MYTYHQAEPLVPSSCGAGAFVFCIPLRVLPMQSSG